MWARSIGVMIAVAVTAGGCTYRRVVREPELAKLERASPHDGVVLHSTTPWRVRLSPSSHIRFRDRAGLWTEWLDASALYVSDGGVYTDGAVRGEPARVGWRWDDVAAAEVQSLSGWRTLGGFVGTLAVSASLVPLGGAPAMTPAVALPALGGPAASTARWGGAQLVRVVASKRHDGTPGTWQPMLVDRTARETRPLFGDGARRRAVARLVVAADAATTFDRDRVIDGVIVAARFGDLVELGGSVRHVAGRGLERAGAWSSAPAGAFYMSGHFALDADERLSVPIGFEVGGSSAGGYVRLRAGLRARVKDAWFVGVYPLSPTFTGTDTDADVLPRWSFPTAIELGSTF
jgi:hypothetical protein